MSIEPSLQHILHTATCALAEGHSLVYSQNKALKGGRGNWWQPLDMDWFAMGRLGKAGGYLAMQGQAQMAKYSQEAETLLSSSVRSC